MMESVNELMTDSTIRNLWLWHSIEETEHKAVAFDLYQHLYGSGLSAYLPRITVFTLSLFLITGFSTIYQFILMKRDHQLLNFKSWRKFFSFASKQYRALTPKFLIIIALIFIPTRQTKKTLLPARKSKLD